MTIEEMHRISIDISQDERQAIDTVKKMLSGVEGLMSSHNGSTISSDNAYDDIFDIDDITAAGKVLDMLLSYGRIEW